MSSARFITLEGIEGVGKSTHVDFIANVCIEHGHKTLVTREPGGTRAGEAIREILLHGKDLDIAPVTELMLMFSARAQHLQEVILPALSNGMTIICDRFTDATYAYQGGGRGIDVEQIRTLEKYVQNGLVPDLTLLFDASVETGQRRAKKRGAADRFESEKVEFFKRVRQSYLQRAAEEPERFRLIDAEQGIAEVQQQIRAVLAEELA
jgi:dTMP kinase